MKRVVKYLHRHITPHSETGDRAAALKHEALLLYAIFLFLLQFGLNTIAQKFPGVLGYASNITVEEIVALTNSERKSYGLAELRFDQRLSQAAMEKASYMFSKGYWAHNAPDGTTPWFFIQKYKYHYLYAGENLAKDFQNSKDVVGAWLASKMGHRENILNGNYADIGVAVTNGVLDGFETTLVVQMFGSEKSSPLAAAAAPPLTEIGPTPAVNQESNLEEKPIALEGPNPEIEKSTLTSGVPPIIQSPSYEKLPQPLIPIVDVVAFGKSISYTFGFFLLGLFIIDSVVLIKKRVVRISGHSTAHIMIVILLLAATWLMSPGTIR